MPALVPSWAAGSWGLRSPREPRPSTHAGHRHRDTAVTISASVHRSPVLCHSRNGALLPLPRFTDSREEWELGARAGVLGGCHWPLSRSTLPQALPSSQAPARLCS